MPALGLGVGVSFRLGPAPGSGGGVVPPAVTGAVADLWTGTTGTDSVTASSKLASPAPARLAVSTTDTMASPAYSAETVPDATFGIVKATVAGLTPNTDYFCAWEVGGQIDLGKVGRLRTAPAGPASFSFAFASCSQSASDVPVYDAINDRRLALFMQLGDLHYRDNTANDESAYHAAFDGVMASTRYGRLLRETPTPYIWDDHDYAGNNGDASAVARPAALAAYRRRVPVQPVSGASGDSVYYSFVHGRVRFVVTDLRSSRTSSTLMGAAQKQWFKDQLLAARAANQFVVWACPTPFVGVPGVGSDASDIWASRVDERAEIAAFITTNGLEGYMCIISGDMHAVALSDPANTRRYGGSAIEGTGPAIPVFHAAPTDRTGSSKGGPYTTGPLNAGSARQSQFGLIDVTDDGTTMALRFRGYRVNQPTGAETQMLDYTFQAGSVPPVEPPANGSFQATGGTITDEGGYRYWTFNVTDTLTVTQGGDVEYLAVGGGGVGGMGGGSAGGGGGAGEVKTDTINIPTGSHPIAIGQGGAANGANGGETRLGSLVTAAGGGAGGYSSTPGSSGASGGGGAAGAVLAAPGSGTSGQGSNGGQAYTTGGVNTHAKGGGGGGAGGVGETAAEGGPGLGGPGLTIFGRKVAAGGSGSLRGSGTLAASRDGIGGASGNEATSPTAGAPNTGSGGGGGTANRAIAAGAAGVVVIRRPS